MEEDVKKLMQTLKSYTKVDKRCNAYIGLLDECKKWLVFLPMVTALRSPTMRERHWDAIRKLAKVDITVDDKLILDHVYAMNLGKFAEDIEEITDQAGQESRIEAALKLFAETWKDIKFDFD